MVLEAQALPDYRLRLHFSDGTTGTADLKDFVFSDHRAIVAALREPKVFAAIRVEADTVVWSNGFDLAPEFLRSKLPAEAAA